MMIYQEKIAPPLALQNHDDQRKLRMKIAANEEKWVEDFINRLADMIRGMKH